MSQSERPERETPRRAKAGSLTRNQKLVLAALEREDRAQTAYNLLDNLRDEGMKAPAQIYRALDKLTEIGLVHRIDSLNAFAACCAPECHGPQGDETLLFMICTGCGGVKELASQEMSRQLDVLCAANGFQADKRVVELHGRCGDCAEI